MSDYIQTRAIPITMWAWPPCQVVWQIWNQRRLNLICACPELQPGITAVTTVIVVMDIWEVRFCLHFPLTLPITKSTRLMLFRNCMRLTYRRSVFWITVKSSVCQWQRLVWFVPINLLKKKGQFVVLASLALLVGKILSSRHPDTLLQQSYHFLLDLRLHAWKIHPSSFGTLLLDSIKHLLQPTWFRLNNASDQLLVWPSGFLWFVFHTYLLLLIFWTTSWRISLQC